jgi:hypothetical protein
MTRSLRLLQLPLVIILVLSVFALIFVTYTQHEEQQRWKGKYDNAIQFQQYWESKYQDAVAQLPVTLSLSWFGNATDVYKTEFMDNLNQNIEPVKVEVHKWNAVTFWFERRDIGNGTILLHLSNQGEGDYNSIDVPFFDIRLVLPH